MWLPEEMEMLTPEPSEMKPHVMVNGGVGVPLKGIPAAISPPARYPCQCTLFKFVSLKHQVIGKEVSSSQSL